MQYETHVVDVTASSHDEISKVNIYAVKPPRKPPRVLRKEVDLHQDVKSNQLKAASLYIRMTKFEVDKSEVMVDNTNADSYENVEDSEPREAQTNLSTGGTGFEEENSEDTGYTAITTRGEASVSVYEAVEQIESTADDDTGYTAIDTTTRGEAITSRYTAIDKTKSPESTTSEYESVESIESTVHGKPATYEEEESVTHTADEERIYEAYEVAESLNETAHHKSTRAIYEEAESVRGTFDEESSTGMAMYEVAEPVKVSDVDEDNETLATIETIEQDYVWAESMLIGSEHNDRTLVENAIYE